MLIKLYWFIVALLLMAATGCLSSMDPEGESDMPWNTPQQWEGSQTLPGMGSGY